MRKRAASSPSFVKPSARIALRKALAADAASLCVAGVDVSADRLSVAVYCRASGDFRLRALFAAPQPR
jgi:hypothetical protein